MKRKFRIILTGDRYNFVFYSIVRLPVAKTASPDL